MLYLRIEIDTLQTNWLIPSTGSFPKGNFTAGLRKSDDFWEALFITPFKIPGKCFIEMIKHALLSVNKLLTSLGEIFFMFHQTTNILENLKDAATHFALAVMLAFSTAIQLIMRSVQFFTRLISSWVYVLSGTEDQVGINQRSIPYYFNKEATNLIEKDYFPSSSNFSKTRFFSPYSPGTEILTPGLSDIVIRPILTGGMAIYSTLIVLMSTVEGMVNLLIGQTNQAANSFCNMTAHLGITLVLALMIPMSALISAIELLTRSASTLVSCVRTPEPHIRDCK